MVNTSELHAAMPLAALLGFRLGETSQQRVELDLTWNAQLGTANGILHGGVLMALADWSGALLSSLNLPKGSVGTTTVESKTNLIRAVRDGEEVRAVATVLHQGRTTIVVETVVTSRDRLVSKTTQTQAILR